MKGWVASDSADTGISLQIGRQNSVALYRLIGYASHSSTTEPVSYFLSVQRTSVRSRECFEQRVVGSRCPRWPRPRAAPGRARSDRTGLRPCRRRHRQDQGHHPPDRLPGGHRQLAADQVLTVTFTARAAVSCAPGCVSSALRESRLAPSTRRLCASSATSGRRPWAVRRRSWSAAKPGSSLRRPGWPGWHCQERRFVTSRPRSSGPSRACSVRATTSPHRARPAGSTARGLGHREHLHGV